MSSSSRPHDHAHDHGHDHGSHHDHAGHGHVPPVTRSNARAVLIGLVLTGAFMVVEVIGGVLSGSLALIADAGHMLTDTVALGLAWVGFVLGSRPADARRSFGYARLEVLAGMINALSLLALVVWIGWEAVQRFLSPGEVLAGPMLVVAVAGLVVNLVVYRILSQADRDHVNIRGALLHVAGDLLGSVAAILAAVAIWLTGWTPIDPLLSLLVCLLLLRGAWSLLTRTFNILMEGAPNGLDPAALARDLPAGIEGLAGVSHLHVWSLSSGRTMATLEIALSPGADPSGITAAVRRVLEQDHDIGHATIEIDWSGTSRPCPASQHPHPASP